MIADAESDVLFITTFSSIASTGFTLTSARHIAERTLNLLQLAHRGCQTSLEGEQLLAPIEDTLPRELLLAGQELSDDRAGLFSQNVADPG